MTLQTGNTTLCLVFPIAVSLKQPHCLMLLNEWWLSPCPFVMWGLVKQDYCVLLFGQKQHHSAGWRVGRQVTLMWFDYILVLSTKRL